jgi:hypothetical protein
VTIDEKYFTIESEDVYMNIVDANTKSQYTLCNAKILIIMSIKLIYDGCEDSFNIKKRIMNFGDLKIKKEIFLIRFLKTNKIVKLSNDFTQICFKRY